MACKFYINGEEVKESVFRKSIKDDLREGRLDLSKILTSQFKIKRPPAEGEPVTKEPLRIVHEDTAKLREQMGLPQYEKTPETVAEWNAKADEAIKNGYDAQALINRMKNGIMPDPVEQIILGKYIGELRIQAEKTMSNEDINKFEDAMNLSDMIGGSLVGKSLRARQESKIPEESLANQLLEEKTSTGVFELTEKQKEFVRTEVEKIQKANDNLNERVKELEEKIASETAIKEIKSASKTKVKAEVVAKKREELKTRLASEFKQYLSAGQKMGITPDGGAEGFVMSAKMAKTVLEIAKTYVQEGVIKLEDVVSNTYDYLKDSIEGIKKEDVLLAIGGRFKDTAPSIVEARTQLNDLKKEAALLSKVLEIQKRERAKNEKEEISQNKEIGDINKQYEDLMASKADSGIEPFREMVKDAAKLKSAITRANKEAEEIQKNIDAGNYESKKKPTPLLEDKSLESKYPELFKQAKEARRELFKLKEEREVRRIKQEIENKTKMQKILGGVLEIGGVSQSLMSTGDFSAPFRQALFATVRYPMLASKSFQKMFESALSEKSYDDWFYDLKASERYELMKKSGLQIIDPHDPRLAAKSEAFMSNVAGKIPALGVVIRGSERAFNSYTNKLAVDVFNKLANQLELQGKTFGNSPELYKKLAEFVNSAAMGRGKLPELLERSAPLLNRTFFSPKLIASRINFLNPYWYAKLPKPIRVEALKSMGSLIGVGVTILGLFAANGYETESDPRSSDFGKIIDKNGVRYDIWGGLSQYVRLLAQLFTSQKKSTTTKLVQDLEELRKTRGSVLGDFARAKLAPLPSAAMDILVGKTFTGEPTTARNLIVTRTIPLLWQDVADAIRDDGIKSIFSVGIPSAFGIGVQRFKKAEETIIENNKQIEELRTQKAQETDSDKKSKLHKEIIKLLNENKRIKKQETQAKNVKDKTTDDNTKSQGTESDWQQLMQK